MDYSTVENLIAIVEESIKESENFTLLPKEIEELRGMSSPKIRRFLNKLCSFGQCTYLEIGTWAGSTLIPALYKNKCYGYAIDNWSQFTKEETGFDAKEELLKNLSKWKEEMGPSLLLQYDCFDKEAQSFIQLKPNVFFLDGNHDVPSTENGIKVYGKLCHNPFVLVVDDLELTPSVWEGTQAALNNFTIHKSWELKKDKDYHEGVFVAVLSD